MINVFRDSARHVTWSLGPDCRRQTDQRIGKDAVMKQGLHFGCTATMRALALIVDNGMMR